jgi:hypothetical protein
MLTQAGKVDLLRSYANGYETFIETGIYNGHGSGHEMLDLFPRVMMLDQSLENCMQARRPLQVLTFPGDSGLMLPHVLARVEEPCLFWLDAHLVAEYDGEAAMHESPCPLLAELRAILAWEHAAASTVLIDDVRLMGEEPGWPALDEVIEVCFNGSLANTWIGKSADDVLRLTPR